MWIITGLGRTGTSYVASFFHKVGVLEGSWNETIKAGFEDPDVTRVNKFLLAQEFIEEKHRKEMRDISNNKIIVKDPRFMLTLSHWIKSGAKLEGVILCERTYYDAIQSMRKSNTGMLRYWYMLTDEQLSNVAYMLEYKCLKQLCLSYEIPFVHTSYPLNTQEYKEMQPVLESVLNPEEAVELWNDREIINGNK